jgi:hypothetical protein
LPDVVAGVIEEHVHHVRRSARTLGTMRGRWLARWLGPELTWTKPRLQTVGACARRERVTLALQLGDVGFQRGGFALAFVVRVGPFEVGLLRRDVLVEPVELGLFFRQPGNAGVGC